MALIAPSILSADFMNLEKDVRTMEQAGAQILHVDVMDGHFVPNLTIGIPVVQALSRCTELILDVHLMISNAEQMAEAYVDAGAGYLSVHVEAVTHLDGLLERIRQKGARPGVALNPHTPLSMLDEILPKCHHVLLMSVNPGFGGQEFISNSLEKVRKLKTLVNARKLKTRIEIDGGIGPHNVEGAVRSGVEILVAGSAIFQTDDPPRVFAQMQKIADQAVEAAKP